MTQRDAAGVSPSEFDPYDWYLAAFRSAYLQTPPAVRDMPTPWHRAAFTLGLDDGRNRTFAPRSRWQVGTALQHVVA